VRVALTLEQCWHAVPGGTAVAAIELARELAGIDGVDVTGIAARHGDEPPHPGYEPPIEVHQLGLPRRAQYARWLWGPQRAAPWVTSFDLVHATTVLPPPTGRTPLVATVHDLAFLRPDAADGFTRNGLRTMTRGWDLVRTHASVICCSSQATLDDCVAHGADPSRLRFVPLGVRPIVGDADEVRDRLGLPERFVLFVGTPEPRKNLARLVDAMRSVPDVPLVIAGPSGWGSVDLTGVRSLGFVDEATKAGLYAAASVVAYPSLWEGFGLPVLEAMAQGATVVTSAGTSCAEVAGDAAVLVDPTSVDAIAERSTSRSTLRGPERKRRRSRGAAPPSSPRRPTGMRSGRRRAHADAGCTSG
jgi:glycosyltransferase involved in cell wall biosynthesis